MSEEQADLRVRRTHKLLWEALMAELSLRSFEEITVKDHSMKIGKMEKLISVRVESR